MVVRADGSNNGVWFAKRQMFIQNEDTADLPGVPVITALPAIGWRTVPRRVRTCRAAASAR